MPHQRTYSAKAKDIKHEWHIIDVTDKSYTIELTGAGSKLDAFLNALERGSILETVRTGASGIGRGDRVLKV